ncbi:MAG: hypothetical protein U1F15_07230 [Burkholderiales bacterium]
MSCTMRLTRVILFAGCAFAATPSGAQTSMPILPEPPGPFAVACSNVEQDFTRIAAGETPAQYWEGVPDGNRDRYVTDLLVDPAHAFVVRPPIPGNPTLFGMYAGQTYPYANLVCYPTDAGNTRADYALPTGNVVPRMQRGAQPPIFPAGTAKYPVLLFSHGLSGSPISGDYIETLKLFASYGYIVVAPFHGDQRFASIELESFADLVYTLLHIKAFVAMQAVRPHALSAALDAVLAHPDFRDRVDADRVGGFGASLGGESLLLMAGAALTASIGQSSTRVMQDMRLKAAVGYVPYFGIDAYPAFGRDLHGLDGVTLPYLALSGTADTTAPISTTERGIHALSGTRRLVAFTGMTHGYDPRFRDEINTWTIRFLAGQFSQDFTERAVAARMTSVQGGGDDVERVDYTAPGPIRTDTGGAPREAIAVEYFDDALGHFFITAEAAEQAMLDAGVVVPGWERTGFAFKVRPAGATLGLSACRFFGTPPKGPNSHFFTIDATECALVKAKPEWTYEGLAFVTDAPAAGICAPDRVPVLRLYNNGMGGQANHRFTTSRSEARAMAAAGWFVEGTVFCAIP